MNVLSILPCLQVFGLLLLLASATPGARGQSVPPLVNYQGRLTDDAGAALPNGTYGVAFRLWNRAVPRADGEQLIWSREYDVSLLHGAFHVILGAPGGTAPAGDPPAAVNDLAFAFGDPDRFFGLTLTRTPTGPVAAPRELVPRQQLLSAPFALQARNADLASGVRTNSITEPSIRSDTIQTRHIADGQVSLAKLAPRIPGTTTALAGGIAVSESSADFRTAVGDTSTWVDVTHLEVTLTTTGRPVILMLQPEAPVTEADDSFIGAESDDERANAFADFAFSCDGVDLGRMQFHHGAQGQYVLVPPSLLSQIHIVGAGTHVYKLRARSGYRGAYARVHRCLLVAFEL